MRYRSGSSGPSRGTSQYTGPGRCTDEGGAPHEHPSEARGHPHTMLIHWPLMMSGRMRAWLPEPGPHAGVQGQTTSLPSPYCPAVNRHRISVATSTEWIMVASQVAASGGRHPQSFSVGQVRHGPDAEGMGQVPSGPNISSNTQ